MAYAGVRVAAEDDTSADAPGEKAVASAARRAY